MFVMLSVHTTTTVRERQADSVNKNKVKTQLYNTTRSLPAKSTEKHIFNNNKQDLNLNLNNLDNKNIKNNNLIISANTKNIASCNSCIKIATDQIVNILPTSIGNSTSILTPSKLSTSSSNLQSKFVLTQLNNFKIPPAVQVPVATILNDLSPIPAPVKVKNFENHNYPTSPMTPSGLTVNTPDIKAMRYYRLWIYTCNAVLLMAVIVFCGVAGKVLLLDYRRLLVSGLNLTHPSFIYAYLALLVQSGFLQLVGCLGALRLSEKLLNAYWLLLLVLLLGDAMLGIFWIYKFDKVMQELKPTLRLRLAHEYGNSIEFTELWDRLQMDGRCCGVSGPQDFIALTNRTYPTSCCTQDITEQISISRRPMTSALVFRNDDVTISTTIRDQHKNLTDIADIALSHVITTTRGGGGGGSINGLDASELKSSSNSGSSSSENNKITIATCRAVYPQGCKEKLVSWLRNTADILFVIGYCVISFLKITFLGILRYEIKEMIQKIKLLQAEMATAILQGDCGIIGSTDQTQSTINPLSINGGLQYGENKVGNRDRDKTFVESNESERESLLVHENPPQKLLRHKQLYSCINEQSGVPGSGDSDTNSNCALIVEDVAISNPLASSSTGIGRRASYSIGTSQQPLEPLSQPTRQQQPTTSSASMGASKKTINGNNNYEMTDFDPKTPNFRRSNAPTVTKI